MDGLKSLLARLTGWRHSAAPGTPDAAADAAPFAFGPDDIKPTITWDSDIDLTLTSLVGETTTKASGRVQVLTIAQLRNELGEAWDRYKGRVLLIAETTIGRMIGKGNVYIPQDEDSWLLLMPSLNESEAEAKADEIAKVLGEKLVGERFQEREPPLPQTAKVDLDKALNADGTFNTAAVKAAVKKVRLVLAARDARRPARELDASKPKAIGTPASFAQASQFPALTLTYRPCWVTETESFSIYALRAFTASGEPLFGPNAPAAVTAALNDATFIDLAKAAFADFTGMTQKNLRATYVLPVPFSIMTRSLGAVFLRALAALPQRERLTCLRIELVNVPPSAAMGTLASVREVFRGRVKDVAFLMDLAQLNDQVMALDHVVLGVEARADGVPAEADFQSALVAFRRRAAGRRAYVMGLRNRASAAFAVQSGMDEISGTGLLDDVRALPDRIQVLYKQDLMRGPQLG